MPLKMYPKEEKKPFHSIKHIIAVAAGKGGVGKSSVTVNLALALKHSGFSVGILDADIYGPSIRKMLPEEHMPGQQGQFFTPALCQGIAMMSMAFFRRDNEAAVIRAPIANGLISQFINNVDWGPLDYLIIDFPPGTGDVQLTLSQHANLAGAVMVTTPQDVAVLDVRKAMNMFHQVKVPIVGVVENMSYYLHQPTNETIYLFGKGGGERLATECGVPFLGSIPIDPDLCRSCDLGESLFSVNAESPAAKAFIELANQVVGHVEALKDQSMGCLHDFELVWKEMSKT